MACSNCTPGKYGWRAGEACEACALGEYQPNSGSISCAPCPADATRSRDHCSLDHRYCIPNSIMTCMCETGTYKVADNLENVTSDFTCTKCPRTQLAFRSAASALCYGGSTMPCSQSGYWAHTDRPLIFLKCNFGTCLPGIQECFGNQTEAGKPGYPLCKSSSHQDMVLSRCGNGATGPMCAQCPSSTIKYGKDCIDCPIMEIGWLLYLIAPLFWVFCFFPGLKV